MIFVASASSCSRSCCAGVGSIGRAAIGRWRIGAGSPARSSSTTAQQIVFQEGIDAIEDAAQRLRRLEQQLAVVVPSWSMAPVVEAYQAMRGASFLVAVIFAAEIGDVRRFDTPRRLMSFLGLVPAESSTGDTV
jgi:transposase